jgi:16S rRNA (guanine527-N7)-methyltransferase
MQSTADLRARARLLGVQLDEPMIGRLLQLLDELAHWSRAYNLTAITSREAMLSTHLLDSLSASTDLTGTRICDLGTGAGFPGLPLAIANPQRRFTLIDSTAKKIRFVEHAARALALNNVEPVHARAESFLPSQPYETIIARAVAPLPKLAALARSLAGPGTRLIAMKGKRPDAELKGIPADWELLRVRELHVPGLDAERCLVMLRALPAPSGAAGSPATAPS